ncbi:hypothetical protein ACE1CD_36700 [Aerosakkonema sp. BLCC-F183]
MISDNATDGDRTCGESECDPRRGCEALSLLGCRFAYGEQV